MEFLLNVVLFFCYFSSMQSQQFAGYGAAYHGGYSGSHAGSHTGSWATEGPSPPALHVHQGSLSAQSRPKPVTTSTVNLILNCLLICCIYITANLYNFKLISIICIIIAEHL